MRAYPAPRIETCLPAFSLLTCSNAPRLVGYRCSSLAKFANASAQTISDETKNPDPEKKQTRKNIPSVSGGGGGGCEGGGGEGVYSFVACLSHSAIDHASLPRRSTVPISTNNRNTSNIWALSTFLPYIAKKNVYLISFLYGRLWPSSTGLLGYTNRFLAIM